MARWAVFLVALGLYVFAAHYERDGAFDVRLIAAYLAGVAVGWAIFGKVKE